MSILKWEVDYSVPDWVPPAPSLGRDLRTVSNNIDERERPRCGVWVPMLGPCIKEWPHTHDEADA